MKIKNKQEKKLFKGLFRFPYGMKVMYSITVSKEKAYVNFCNRIADQQRIRRESVYELFTEKNQNYEIIEVQ